MCGVVTVSHTYTSYTYDFLSRVSEIKKTFGNTTHTFRYAYCDNNPVVRVDHGGQFWNTIIGMVAGAVVGGISAAILGTSIKAGIVSGAVSGAISGAAIDFAVFTGGLGIVGVSLISGAGNAIGSYINQRMNGTDVEDINWKNVAVDGVWGMAAGALSYGVTDVGNVARITLKELLKHPVKEVAQKASYDLAMTTAITGGTWLNATRMAAYTEMRKNSVERKTGGTTR